MIYIDFSRLPRDCRSYEQYICRIHDGINRDLTKVYPALELDINGSAWDNLQIIHEQENIKFIFVMDEGDAIFHSSFITEESKKRYLVFLRDLLPRPRN